MNYEKNKSVSNKSDFKKGQETMKFLKKIHMIKIMHGSMLCCGLMWFITGRS